jgi:hypothetical protein
VDDTALESLCQSMEANILLETITMNTSMTAASTTTAPDKYENRYICLSMGVVLSIHDYLAGVLA